MAFVLDASIAACWILPDEESITAVASLERLNQEMAWVPSLWWFEVRNLLVMNERRRRITPDITAIGLHFISNLQIDIDHEVQSEHILDLARKHRLTFYDAAYLELAIRKSLPLATLDEALILAAKVERVTLL